MQELFLVHGTLHQDPSAYFHVDTNYIFLHQAQDKIMTDKRRYAFPLVSIKIVQAQAINRLKIKIIAQFSDFTYQYQHTCSVNLVQTSQTWLDKKIETSHKKSHHFYIQEIFKHSLVLHEYGYCTIGVMRLSYTKLKSFFPLIQT